MSTSKLLYERDDLYIDLRKDGMWTSVLLFKGLEAVVKRLLSKYWSHSFNDIGMVTRYAYGLQGMIYNIRSDDMRWLSSLHFLSFGRALRLLQVLCLT